MREPILSVQNLSMVYTNGTVALKNVSFDVQQGEFLVVIGLSGSGKSTLLRCLNRLIKPTSGKILFRNQDVAQVEGSQVLELRKKMGMIFQHFNLVPRFTVMKNVLTGRLGQLGFWRSFLGLFQKSDQEKAMGCLKLVGIDSKAFVRTDQLSGGQQQRVAIARALSQNPEVLLADEPVASLDPATCYVVMDYLKKVNRELGLTVICNLHFLSLVRQYGSRVIALKDGVIVFDGNPLEIDQEWFRKIYGEEAREVHAE